MYVEQVDDPQRLLDMAEDWDDLFKRSGDDRIFARHAWVAGCLRNFPAGELRLLLCRSPEGALLGALPLRIREFSMRGGVRWRALTHLCEIGTDYSCILVDRAANNRLVIKRFIEHIQGEGDWDYVLLNNLASDDEHANLLRVLFEPELYGASFASAVLPLIRLDQPHEEAKFTGNIRRRFRKAPELHDVQLSIGGPVDAAQLKEMRHLHERGFPNQGFNRPPNQSLYRELISNPATADLVEFSSLRLDGELAAAHFGFRSPQRVMYYVPAFDRKFATFGVGQYLLGEMIRHYREAGYAEFDFLRGREKYKFYWANGVRTNYTVFGVPHGRASVPRKLFANLWLATKALPFFSD